MLNDRKLAEHLGSVHLDQAREHLAPVGDCTDVPKLVAVLVERTGLHLVDIRQASKELVLFGKHLGYLRVWDGLWLNPGLFTNSGSF